MFRREVLIGCSLGIGALSGCVDSKLIGSASIGDGLSVETDYTDRDVLEDGLWSRRHEDNQYHLLIVDEATVEEQVSQDERDRSIIANTDFSTSYLLVVQYGMQSDIDLELASISRSDDELHVGVSTDSPFIVGDDWGVHSLILRITDEREGVPETVTVEVDD